MSRDQEGDNDRLTASAALRHVLIFQIKLAADALRDFLLSPMSLIAFAIDAITKPSRDKSLYLRLMLFGRRSDRMINLFDDYDNDCDDTGGLSIDRAVDELEGILRTGQGSEHRGTDRSKASKADDSA